MINFSLAIYFQSLNKLTTILFTKLWSLPLPIDFASIWNLCIIANSHYLVKNDWDKFKSRPFWETNQEKSVLKEYFGCLTRVTNELLMKKKRKEYNKIRIDFKNFAKEKIINLKMGWRSIIFGRIKQNDWDSNFKTKDICMKMPSRLRFLEI